MTYRIVVGMDLGEPGDTALREALRLAARVTDSEVHPVHAIAADPAVEVGAVDEMDRHLQRGMELLKARVESVALDAGTPAKTRLHVRFGDPVAVLQQAAVDYDCDVLVVGTHGRRGMERLLLGSVASDLVKVARLPVLVAREKDFAGLERTEEIEPARPGEDLHRQNIVSDLSQVGPRKSHISGLV